MCCLCCYQWDQDMQALEQKQEQEQKRRMEEEEEEFIEHPCRNCGGDGGDDGPVSGFCSRPCLREWTRGMS